MRLPEYVLVCSMVFGYDLVEDMYHFLKIYEKIEEGKSSRIMKNVFPRESPLPYLGLDKNYLLRRHQDKYNYNHSTGMPFNGLQRKANQEYLKEMRSSNERREQAIKETFSYDNARRREQKRWESMKRRSRKK